MRLSKLLVTLAIEIALVRKALARKALARKPVTTKVRRALAVK